MADLIEIVELNLEPQVTQVEIGQTGPGGPTHWSAVADKPDFDALYDPVGSASAAQSAAASDATAKAGAAQAAAIAAAATDATTKANAAQTAAIDTLRAGVASDGDTLAKLRALIQGLQTLLSSDRVDLDTLQEVVDFVEVHQSSLESLGAGKVNVSDIINVLTDASTNKPLSAAQGKALKDLLDTLTEAVDGKEPTISAGTSAQYLRGDKTWRDFATDVLATVLTGLSTASAAVVSATDSVLGAIGKLQAQISDVITQADAEAGTATAVKAWTSLRVRQAWNAAWAAISTIDGKAIGNTTRSTGKFTTLEANSSVTLGAAASVNTISGTTNVTANSVGGAGVAISRITTATSGHSTFGIGATMRISTEANAAGYEIGGNFVLYPAVKSGYTQGGYTKGAEMSVLRNIVSLGYDDNGTLSTMQGLSIAVGHYNTSGSATPATTTCSGISITPYCLTGSITNLFGMNIGAVGGAANVAAASALKLGFMSTVEAHRNIDASGTAYNYLAGNTGIGVQPSASAKLDVAGPMRWGQYTLSTLPSAAAYSGCNIDVVNATGGPKTCRSNGTNWHILNTTTPVS